MLSLLFLAVVEVEDVVEMGIIQFQCSNSITRASKISWIYIFQDLTSSLVAMPLCISFVKCVGPV